MRCWNEKVIISKTKEPKSITRKDHIKNIIEDRQWLFKLRTSDCSLWMIDAASEIYNLEFSGGSPFDGISWLQNLSLAEFVSEYNKHNKTDITADEAEKLIVLL